MKNTRYSRRRQRSANKSCRTLFYHCIRKAPGRIKPHGLAPNERLVLLTLARFMHKDTLRDCSMSFPQLSSETDLGISTAMRAVKGAAAKGWLHVTPRKGHKSKSGQKQNLYHGLIPAAVLAQLGRTEDVSERHVSGQDVSERHGKTYQSDRITEESTKEEKESYSQRPTSGKERKVVGPLPPDLPAPEHLDWIKAHRPLANPTAIVQSFGQYKTRRAERQMSRAAWLADLQGWFENEKRFLVVAASVASAAAGSTLNRSQRTEMDRFLADKLALGPARAKIRFDLRAWQRQKGKWAADGSHPGAPGCRTDVKHEASLLAQEDEKFAAFLLGQSSEEDTVAATMAKIKIAVQTPAPSRRRDAA